MAEAVTVERRATLPGDPDILPLGAVVRHKDGRRGVVVVSMGKPTWLTNGLMGANDAMIQESPGISTVTNMHWEWEVQALRAALAALSVSTTEPEYGTVAWYRAHGMEDDGSFGYGGPGSASSP